MDRLRLSTLALVLALGGPAWSACSDKPDDPEPEETTGGEAEEAAEETGEAIEEGAEEAGDAVEQGAEEAGDAVDETTEDVDDGNND